MKFGEAIASVFKNYVNFRGRARRSEFWYFYLFYVIVNTVLSIPSTFWNVMGTMAEPDPEIQVILSLLFGLPSIIFSLATFLPYMAVTVRRLHDIGKSGWYYLFPFIPLGAIVIIAVLFFIVSTGTGFGGISVLGIVIAILYVIAIIVMIAFIVVVIVWLCRDSQPGENKWGPNPKGF